MILRPDEVVMAQLFDSDGVVVPIAAIQLVDFYNQQLEDFASKFTTVTMLVPTWAGWGRRRGAARLGGHAAFAISAGSIVVKAYRKEIAKTAGGLFLEAWDMAEGVANLYGWGRLGVDGLRLRGPRWPRRCGVGGRRDQPGCRRPSATRSPRCSRRPTSG